MNLYWFSDHDGHEWNVFTAGSEERAWQLLMKASRLNDALKGKPLEDVKAYYDLDGVTKLNPHVEGQVAWILPLQVNFAIFQKAGIR